MHKKIRTFDADFLFLLSRSPQKHRSEMDDYLFIFLYKLYNAINTNRLAGLRVNEDISRVHIFKVQSVANIVHTIAISIVMKAFGCNHLVNLRFCGKSLTTDIRLRENNAEQAIRVSRKANSGHLRFRKQSIVEHYRF